MKQPTTPRRMGIFLGILVAGGLIFWFYQRYSSWGALATRIAEMGPAGRPPQTVEELQKAIATYEGRIERYVRDAAQLGIYWKILAVRLMDRKMYGEALDALERAIHFYPEDPSLQYMKGLSAAIMAKSTTGKERSAFFSQAEQAHLRALEIDPAYYRSRYALGVLYVFELNTPERAIPHLEMLLEQQKKDVDAHFVLARAYYETGQYRKALDLYDRILSITKVAEKRRQAEENKKIVQDLLNE
ncbi:MAG: tetratricopeptide repeat protein [Treponemataceae bacterium]|nr:tetratricopeptide repeat protein [Treponemataceae bacterium]